MDSGKGRRAPEKAEHFYCDDRSVSRTAIRAAHAVDHASDCASGTILSESASCKSDAGICESSEPYYIFGAHSRARTLREYLRVLEPSMHLVGYLVDNNEPNPEEQDEVPVLHLMEGEKNQTDARAAGAAVVPWRLDVGLNNRNVNADYPVYIATRGVSHPHIIFLLKEYGFTDIRPVTADLDCDLRNRYMPKRFALRGVPYRKIDEIGDSCTSTGEEIGHILPEAGGMRIDTTSTGSGEDTEARIYVARSWNDRPLQEEPGLKPWESVLQVGTELAPGRLSDASYYDNVSVQGEGFCETISGRNRQFCELTGLYWIWKNHGFYSEIIGLEHYRRRFLLPDNWESRFAASGAEAILPVPLCVMPSLAENFRLRHDPGIWDCAMRILREQHPEDAVAAEKFFDEPVYSPCNMFIMRWETLDRYCSWLFPMLFAIAAEEGEKADPYLNRYPGFIAERFLSFWCSRYILPERILFSDKSFLT